VASEFVLHLKTDIDKASVLRLLADAMDVSQDRESGDVITTVVHATALEASLRRKQLFNEFFGFEPTLGVSFRIRSKSAYLAAKNSVLHASIALLRQVPGNAILLFNGESIVFERIDSRLIFNELFGRWDSSQLDRLVEGSYEVRSLPSPLL